MTGILDGEPLDSASGWVAEHTRRYVETGGREGHEWRGVPTLVLTTKGRKTGQPRRNALIYGRDGEKYVIVASKGGAPLNPMWFGNLVVEPAVRIQVGGDVLAAVARTAQGAERDRLWSTMAKIWPDYETYQAKTDRQIPVIVLEPIP